VILLPFFAFLSILTFIAGREEQPDSPETSWIADMMTAAAAWGVCLVLASEILTLFDFLTRTGVAFVWLGIAVVFLGLAQAGGRTDRFISRLRGIHLAMSSNERAVALTLALFIGILLMIALIAPPNNVDSFLYHMSRVVHWAQDASLEHYPATIDHQLLKPIYAEEVILHLRLLWGNDRLSNLVQWFSMLGSLICVVGLAQLLGSNRKGRILAAVFALTIPMGILQATSTQNDYVAAYWAVSTAYFVVLAGRRDLTRVELLAFAASFGLGMLTKGTYFVYAPPFMLWYFLRSLVRSGILRTFGRGLAVLSVAVVLNLGFWSRNVATFGGPYGTSDWLQRNLGFDVEFFNRLFESGGELEDSGGTYLEKDMQAAKGGSGGDILAMRLSPESFAAEGDASGGMGSRLLQYLKDMARVSGRNFTFPLGIVARALIGFANAFPGVFGPGFGTELQASAWNHEDHAGNLIQLLLVLATLPLLIIRARRARRTQAAIYGAAAFACFLLLPVVIGHSPSYWGVRYQLPFFVLWAPAFGYAFSGWERRWIAPVLTWLLLAAALPWLLMNNTRPLIGHTPWPTKIRSIFRSSQAEILFANNPALKDDYVLTASAIQQAGCQDVGLIAEVDFLEYPLWWLLDAPQSGTHLQVIVADDDPLYIENFTPCAVVCDMCGDQESVRGLDDAYQFDTLRLFLEGDRE
jgi:4-amino-4-deoxy-L-arabinose transferase-like glycosyltransferase